MGLFQRKNTKKHHPLTETQQLYFLQRLDRLLNDGYALIDALEVIKWDKQFRETAAILTQSLVSGSHVDEAFEAATFHSAIISYLYFVRINGDIDTSITKCIHMFEHRLKYINKFKQVIRYPAVLGCIFIVLLIFLKTSVLPAFLEIFQMSAESTTSIILSISAIDLISTGFFILLLFILFTVFFWKVYKKNIAIDRQLAFYQRIPFYSRFLQMQTSYYFATHMAMFLKSGMSMKDVIFHMYQQKKLPIIAYYAELMTEELQNGFYIDQLLEHLYFIDPQLAVIFQKSNNVEALQLDLSTYGDFLTEMMEQKLMRIITAIQPTVFIMLACFIILTYVTLMWPMFQLIETI